MAKVESEKTKSSESDKIKYNGTTKLIELSFLEEKCRNDGIDNLIKEFNSVISGEEKYFVHTSGNKINVKVLEKIQKILVKYRDFLHSHGETLFQTLYNEGFWQDCSVAKEHYFCPVGLWKEKMPWEIEPEECLSEFLEVWRKEVEKRADFFWIKACRPPESPFEPGFQKILKGHNSDVRGAKFIRDGKEIISWTQGGEVIKWDTAS